MTLSSVFALIGSIATIVGGIVFFVKKFSKSPSQRDQDTDVAISEEEKAVKAGGRPKWGP